MGGLPGRGAPAGRGQGGATGDLQSPPLRDDRLDPVLVQFGDELPDTLHALSDAELADLGSALAEAQDEQSRALDDAIGHTLRFLPWPLSSIVRKVLIG